MPKRLTKSRLAVGVLLLGLLAGCGSGKTGLGDPCPVFGYDRTASHLDATITLDAATVRAGESFSGIVELRNPSTETVYYPFNGSVQVALLFTSGTDTPVAVYTEPVTAAADALPVPAGGTASLALVGGTTPCGPDAPARLAAGEYDVRFAMVAGLSDPVTIHVTE